MRYVCDLWFNEDHIDYNGHFYKKDDNILEKFKPLIGSDNGIYKLEHVYEEGNIVKGIFSSEQDLPSVFPLLGFNAELSSDKVVEDIKWETLTMQGLVTTHSDQNLEGFKVVVEN